MRNDNKSNLRQYITSPEFSRRVGDVVEETVCDLERRGFVPVYDRTGEQKDKPEVTPAGKSRSL
jgi:hypothetical protein